MLTGELEPTSGSFGLREDASVVGYCPQENSLDPLLTVKETLHAYCMMKGLPAGEATDCAVRRALGSLDIEGHADRLGKQLSGGTKRKVCAAVALLGGPQLVLMDEPTSGMDVVAKRLMWKVIRREMAAGASVILTSHSMEECEALCTRIAIMADGSFRCIGSPEHIKRK